MPDEFYRYGFLFTVWAGLSKIVASFTVVGVPPSLVLYLYQLTDFRRIVNNIKTEQRLKLNRYVSLFCLAPKFASYPSHIRNIDTATTT
jgi:hypothetical protein